LFFEVGAADLFWKSSGKRRLIRRASRAVVCGSRGRGSDSWEGLQQVHVSDAASLAPERRTATELHNARLECDWSEPISITGGVLADEAMGLFGM
jgi:hypothetical protein